jgi:aromatic ring-opening dioxygenase catalytic subunit (LigB family)
MLRSVVCLIVAQFLQGSGAITHNLGKMGRPYAKPARWASEFAGWVEDGMLKSTPKERIQRFLALKTAPHFRDAHPQEDHFIPLLVVLGSNAQDITFDKSGKLQFKEDSVAAAVNASGDSEITTIANTERVNKIHSVWALETFCMDAYKFEQ